jgi:GNAT superfamily N-acetyltransferase
MPLGVQVAKAAPGDVDRIADSLARAFYDDPFTMWALPDDHSRPARLRRFFLVDAALHMRRGEVWAAPDGASAALWAAPGRWRMPISTVLGLAPHVGLRAPLVMRGLRRIESRHPRWPHWYLAVLGTDPPMQGSGLGAAVLEPVLRRCDEQGLGAYLESTKERNVPYYRRHGFEVVDEVSLPRGPRVWLMWRTPAQ